MEERWSAPNSPEVARPLSAAPLRTHAAITLTEENLQTNSFIRLGRDVHGLILDRCATTQDAVNLASSCFTLWSKSQGALFNRVLREAPDLSDVDGLSYIADMIECNPILRRYGFNYRHLATILLRARTLLDSMIKTDPHCAWKVAAVCGLKGAVKELLGSTMGNIIDPYGRDVLAYYALGGHLDLMIEFIEEQGIPIPINPERLLIIARLAAIGGQKHVLKYLRDTHGLKMDLVIPGTDDLPDETLLHSAVIGGDRETIAFLRKKKHGIDLNIGKSLALAASGAGRWEVYDDFAREKDPLTDIDVATELAQDALRRGNLALACAVIERFDREGHPIDRKKLVMHVFIGGDVETFRYALKKGWFKLNDNFGDYESTLQHLLAQLGHLNLLVDVLEGAFKNNTEEEAIAWVNIAEGNDQNSSPAFVIDNAGCTLLHAAAQGGHWKIYCYLLKHYFQKNPLPEDYATNTVAHSAARGGNVWFLKKLFNSEGGHELVSRNRRLADNAPILFNAAYCGESYFLFMIIEEFGIDVRSTDKSGNTVLHILADIAENQPSFWDVVEDLVARYPDMGLLDISNKEDPPKTVRQIIFEADEDTNAPKHLLDLEVGEENIRSEGLHF